MTKLDPQLQFLVDGGVKQLDDTNETGLTKRRFGIGLPVAEGEEFDESKDADKASVMALYDGHPADLKKAGLDVQTIAGDVVSGLIHLKDVTKLAKLAQVERLEAARPMHAELDRSIVECRADEVHTGPPGRRGAGVIVGICDTGCDFTHPSFRNADGSSRILFIWDQGLRPQGSENSPTGFSYGVEYNKVDIDAALASSSPFNSVRHRDRGGHGTHVAGIAAGDGSVAGQGQPANTFVGVAPEADLIIVAVAPNGNEGLGTSASTLDAVNYMYRKAEELSRPCAVNMSLGDNLGPHDGTSLLERGLDNLLGRNGRAFVKSAGNAGFARTHAQGNFSAGRTETVRFNQPAGDGTPNQIDLWYNGSDTAAVSIVDPNGDSTPVINVGNAQTTTLPSGNVVRVDHRDADPFNGDRRVFITLLRGNAGSMAAGNWGIRLRGVSAANGGRFDGWIQRGRVVPAFIAPHANAAMTISTPGTAREVITAASYITRGSGVGGLASSSSRGPTRDGRAAPTLAAPGQFIISADGESSGGDPYRSTGGTSMAAPHITGTIALMFQKNAARNQEQIRNCLVSSAAQDAQTGPVPNTAWGAGKLDTKEAVDCVPSAGPQILPSLVGPRCRPSVITTCLSVPRTSCSIRPTVITRLCNTRPSIPRITCVQTVVRCPTIPAQRCQTRPSVAVLCPSVSLRCPSVADGCPSTPGGCQFQSVAARCRGGFRIPGGRFNPRVNPRLDPRIDLRRDRFSRFGREFYEFDEDDFGYDEEFDFDEEFEFDDEDEAMNMHSDPAMSPQVPDSGYFEYDESWFDITDKDGLDE
ncbi:MAG: S8 family peptidase [Pseudomonadota bacterium]